MRILGHNVLAIALAAIVIYAIEFVIFGLAIPGEQYEKMVGLMSSQMHAERMPLGIIPPILTAIGLSLAIRWRAMGLRSGVLTGVLMAVFFAFASSLYPYIYGSNTEEFLMVNLGHYLVCYAAGGAIIGLLK